MELFEASLGYKQFSDISPHFFWDFSAAFQNCTADSLRSLLFDKLTVTSNSSRQDDIINTMDVFPNIWSETVYLRLLIKIDLQQKVYDLEQIWLGLIQLQDNKVPYYPIRFNFKALYYEVFNYSTYVWVPVSKVLEYHMLDFYLLEKEYILPLGGTHPKMLSKYIDQIPLIIVNMVNDLFFIQRYFYNFLLLPYYFYLVFCESAFMTHVNYLLGPYWKVFSDMEREGPLFDFTLGVTLGEQDLVWYEQDKLSLAYADAERSGEFHEFMDKDIIQPYWFRLGIMSSGYFKEKDLNYDPRFRNDFFYALVDKMSPDTEGIDPLPYSLIGYKDLCERKPFRAGKRRKFWWPYDDYVWAGNPYEPILERNFKIDLYRELPKYPHFKYNMQKERIKYMRFKYLLKTKARDIA